MVSSLTNPRGLLILVPEQDDRLDHLSHSISRQHHISLQINDELEVHTGLLDGLDQDLDGTHTRLSGARRRLDRVAKGAKENSSSSRPHCLLTSDASPFSNRFYCHYRSTHFYIAATHYSVQDMTYIHSLYDTTLFPLLLS